MHHTVSSISLLLAMIPWLSLTIPPLQWNSIIQWPWNLPCFQVPGGHWQSCSVPVTTLNKLWMEKQLTKYLFILLPLFPSFFFPLGGKLHPLSFQNFHSMLKVSHIGRSSKWIKREGSLEGNRRRSAVNQSIVNSERKAQTQRKCVISELTEWRCGAISLSFASLCSWAAVNSLYILNYAEVKAVWEASP